MLMFTPKSGRSDNAPPPLYEQRATRNRNHVLVRLRYKAKHRTSHRVIAKADPLNMGDLRSTGQSVHVAEFGQGSHVRICCVPSSIQQVVEDTLHCVIVLYLEECPLRSLASRMEFEGESFGEKITNKHHIGAVTQWRVTKTNQDRTSTG